MGIGKFEKNQFFNRKSVIPEIFWGKDFIIPFSETDTGALALVPQVSIAGITEDIPVGCKMHHDRHEIQRQDTSHRLSHNTGFDHGGEELLRRGL